MRGRIWETAFSFAVIIHLILFSALGYVMREGPKQEIQYIEVTMDELFAGPPDDQPPGGGGGGGSPANSPQKAERIPQQAAAPSIAESAAVQPQKNAESVPDMPVFAGNGPSTSTGSAETGNSTGDGETGNGSGNGTGWGSGNGTGWGSGNGSGTGSGNGSGAGSGNGAGRGSKRNPHVIAGSRPPYPQDARANGWEGTVHVRVLVSEDGEAEEITIAASSGYDSLDMAVLREVRGWQFSPALDDDGQPVAAWVTWPVRFDLTNAD